MEVDCAGCAGCCIDWRPLLEADASPEHERRGQYVPLDDTYNLVALERDEVRAVLEAGLGDALSVRLWDADGDGATGRSDGGRRSGDREGETGASAVELDGHRLAAVAGRPVFFVGLRKPPKPVAPFGRDSATWLPACVFLDPETLQCRIHDDDLYPAECAEYPANNLALERESECERVEDVFGGERLLDADPGDVDGPQFGPQALGGKVFTHPRPEDLEGVVDRAARGALTAADRAEFVAVAAASSPGLLAVSEPHYQEARRRALAADSWAGRAIDAWSKRAGAGGAPEATLARTLEVENGAPETSGWSEFS